MRALDKRLATGLLAFGIAVSLVLAAFGERSSSLPTVHAQARPHVKLKIYGREAVPRLVHRDQIAKPPHTLVVASSFVHRKRGLRGVRRAVIAQARFPTVPVEQQAYLDLIVNGVSKGQVIAIVTKDDVLIPFADFERTGITGIAPSTKTVNGRKYVLLRSLSPAVTLAFDERNLKIQLSTQAAYLGTNVVNLAPNRVPAGIIYTKTTSGFFNYALDWQNFSQLTESSEIGISANGNLYYTGFTIGPDGRFVRGLSNVTFDNPGLMKRWVIGDSFVESGQLGGNGFIGGVGVSRNFSLNPYFVTYPGVGVSGQTLSPSTAYVYVNGYLVSTEQLPPGKFTISNIPVVTGGGNTQVVVRDAFGNTQTLSSSYYYAPQLLARGLSAYSYNLGAERNNVGVAGGDYGPIQFIGSDLVGITDWFTAGARLEAGPGMLSGGPAASFRLPSGQLDVNAALSHGSAGGGGAGEADYTHQDARVSYGGSIELMSRNYVNASLTPQTDRAVLSANGFAGVALGSRTSVTVNYAASDWRDAGPRRQISVAGSQEFTDRLGMVLTATHTSGANTATGTQYFLSLNYRLGHDSLAAVSQQGGNQGSGTSISAQHSLPLGSGMGYLIEHGTGSQFQNEDILQYQTQFGFYQASYLQYAGRSQKDVLLSGGIVDAGDGWLMTRAVGDAFAVIDVPGVGGVRGYYNNQLIGRTDAHGRLLVPNLLAYYGNQMQIADQDIPIDYNVEGTQETVAPPYRGGAVIRFPVKRLQAVTGQIFIDNAKKRSVPSFGELRIMVGPQLVVSELGRQGEFYLENMTAGRYAGVVDYAEGSCTLELTVPRKHDALTDMGSVRCGNAQISQGSP